MKAFSFVYSLWSDRGAKSHRTGKITRFLSRAEMQKDYKLNADRIFLFCSIKESFFLCLFPLVG